MIHHIDPGTMPFTVYQKKFARSRILSFEAKGLLRYLLAMPQVYFAGKLELKRDLGIGRMVQERLIRELIAAGYIERRRDSYTVYEDPDLAKRAKADERQCGVVRYGTWERYEDYAITDDPPFLDRRLSLRARGLLCFLLTLPEDYEPKIANIAAEFYISKRVISKLFKELLTAGYCEKIAKRGENGRLCGWQFNVYENPSDRPKAVKSNHNNNGQ